MVRKLLRFVIQSLKLYDYIHGSKRKRKNFLRLQESVVELLFTLCRVIRCIFNPNSERYRVQHRFGGIRNEA